MTSKSDKENPTIVMDGLLNWHSIKLIYGVDLSYYLEYAEMAQRPRPGKGSWRDVAGKRMSGFFVEFRKDIYNDKYLSKLGLNERRMKAVLFAIEQGKVTNKEHQELNKISKRTASNELTELVEKYKILIKSGTYGAGISYKVIGQ